MNTNPNAVRVLCYGDSNTWGADPKKDVRYQVNVRWTGLLQTKLGDGYEIIEEGLCGRTTILDDPKEEGRNGKTYLMPCLETHKPIDIAILMLGTNDLKERFNLSAQDIARNTEELVQIIKIHAEVILISPSWVNEHIVNSMEGMSGAEEKSKQFAQFYEQVAKKHNCSFIDITQHIQPSIIDGCHFDPEAHAKIAEVLAKKLLEIAGTQTA